MRIPTCFLDIVLILLIFMIILYSPEVKKSEEETPKSYAEFILNVSWKSDLNADIDTWAMRTDNPDSVTGYTRRENDVFILHNDNTSSQYGEVDGQTLKESREVLTIETVKQGEYLFSLHGFRVPMEVGSVEVTVELQKSRPYKHIFKKTVTVMNGLEAPVATVMIDEDGNVVDVNLDSIRFLGSK